MPQCGSRAALGWLGRGRRRSRGSARERRRICTAGRQRKIRGAARRGNAPRVRSRPGARPRRGPSRRTRDTGPLGGGRGRAPAQAGSRSHRTVRSGARSLSSCRRGGGRASGAGRGRPHPAPRSADGSPLAHRSGARCAGAVSRRPRRFASVSRRRNPIFGSRPSNTFPICR